MPNIKSAKKRVKVSNKKTEFNKSQKSAVRTAVKKAQTAIENKSEQAGELVKDAVVKIDKAAGKGKIHKNTAAHKKSRLAKSLNQM